MGKTPQRIVELLHAEIPGKISKNKFCIQTGINQNSVDKYMAGITEPTQVSMLKLADYFKVSVPWLRGEYAYDYEEERRIFEFILLPGEVQAKKLVRAFGGEEKAVEAMLVKSSIDSKKYPDLARAFFRLPIEDLDDAIDALLNLKIIRTNYSEVPPNDNNPKE